MLGPGKGKAKGAAAGAGAWTTTSYGAYAASPAYGSYGGPPAAPAGGAKGSKGYGKGADAWGADAWGADAWGADAWGADSWAIPAKGDGWGKGGKGGSWEAPPKGKGKGEKRPASAPANAPTSTGQTYTGTVKSFSHRTGFGFIACDETKAEYGKDVWCTVNEIGDKDFGAVVRFELGLSSKGEPQAMNVHLVEDAPQAKRRKVVKAEVSEVLAVANEDDLGLGAAVAAFIEENALDEATAAVLKQQAEEVQLAVVEEGPVQNKNVAAIIKSKIKRLGGTVDTYSSGGGLKAAIMNHADQANDGAYSKRKKEPQGTGQIYHGFVKSFAPQTNYGFITCEEVKEDYGCDVFCRGVEIQDKPVGSNVTFELGLSNDGKPQALNVKSDGTKHAPETASAEMAKTDIAGAVKLFIEENELDEKASAALNDQPKPVQKRIIGEGSISGANPSAILMSKIKSQGGALGSTARAGQYADPWGGAKGGGHKGGGKGKGGGGGQWMTVDDYVWSYQLSPPVANALWEQPPEIQSWVMSEGPPTPQNPIIQRIKRLGGWVSDGWDVSYGKGGAGKGGKAKGKGGSKNGGERIQHDPPKATGEYYSGTVKSFSEKHFYGFLECPEVHSKYGGDVWCSGREISEIPVGTAVTFELGLNKQDKPQAIDVTPA